MNDDTAPPVPDPGPFQGLGLRIVSGIVLAAAAIGAVLSGGIFFSALVVLAVLLMIREWPELCLAGAGARPLWRPQPPLAAAVFVALALAALGLLVLYELRAAAVLAFAGVLVLPLFAGGSPRDRLLLGAGLPYIVLPSAALLWLVAQPVVGPKTVLWLFAVVWATDIGGYLAGKSIGGPKLAPSISPNKTWAGFFGGTLLAAAAAAAFVPFAGGAALKLAGFGILVSLASQAGDLLESAVKRHFAVKDSGSIIPGHGGIFDRLDGLLAAAPVLACLATALGDLGFLWR